MSSILDNMSCKNERLNQMAIIAPFDLTRVSFETLLLDCSR